MDKTYNNIWILFLTILAFVFLGFFKSYFGLLSAFEKIPSTYHFHTILFLLWFVLLFIQPFLIKRRNLKLHRLLGKCTYILVPLLIVSIFMVTKRQYLREIVLYPRSQCIANLIIPLPQLIIFVAMYILAILNIKNTGYHMRYIIGTSLVLIGPGLGRAFISLAGISFQQSVQLSFLVTELILAVLIIIDIKKGNHYKPYAILLIIFLCCHLGWFFMPYSWIWQTLCGKFADLFF
ncbi:MAG: hypothetical protein WAT34_02865 [Chitinophagaceae bacterium]